MFQWIEILGNLKLCLHPCDVNIYELSLLGSQKVGSVAFLAKKEFVQGNCIRIIKPLHKELLSFEVLIMVWMDFHSSIGLLAITFFP